MWRKGRIRRTAFVIFFSHSKNDFRSDEILLLLLHLYCKYTWWYARMQFENRIGTGQKDICPHSRTHVLMHIQSEFSFFFTHSRERSNEMCDCDIQTKGNNDEKSRRIVQENSEEIKRDVRKRSTQRGCTTRTLFSPNGRGTTICRSWTRLWMFSRFDRLIMMMLPFFTTSSQKRRTACSEHFISSISTRLTCSQTIEKTVQVGGNFGSSYNQWDHNWEQNVSTVSSTCDSLFFIRQLMKRSWHPSIWTFTWLYIIYWETRTTSNTHRFTEIRKTSCYTWTSVYRWILSWDPTLIHPVKIRSGRRPLALFVLIPVSRWSEWFRRIFTTDQHLFLTTSSRIRQFEWQ